MPDVAPDVDVRVGAEDAVADLLLQARHDGERDDDRRDADGDADDRDERDQRDQRLLALCQQVPQRDLELERKGHHPTRPFLLINGNRITSRIDGLLVSTITSRSIPTPSPAVGGRPYSSARM